MKYALDKTTSDQLNAAEAVSRGDSSQGSLRLAVNMESARRQTIGLWAAYVLVISAAFVLSLIIRWPYLGDTGDFGSILQWTLQWYHEGPLALKFGLFDHFSALETSTLALRDDYASYPAGTIVVPWLVAGLLQMEPTPALISIVNMGGQLVFALTLSAIAAVMTVRFRWPAPLVLVIALAPALVAILSRGPMNYFMIYHVHDVAVLPWIGLFLLTEVLLDRAEGGRRLPLQIGQQFFAFMAAYTEWFFFFVIAAVFARRILLRQMPWRPWRRAIRSVALFGSGTAIAMTLYVYSVTALERWPQVAGRFAMRTSLSDDRPNHLADLFQSFWESALAWNFNNFRIVWLTYAMAFGLLTAIAAIGARRRSLAWMRRETKELLGLLLVLLLAPLAQIYVFSDHTYNHLWSGLKFVLVLALVTFSFGPVIVIEAVRDMAVAEPYFRVVCFATAASALPLAAVYTYAGTRTLMADFGAPTFAQQKIGKTIGKYAEPSDIIVSPQFEVLPKSIMFPFTRRVVYLSPDPSRPLFISHCLGIRHDFLVVLNGPLPTAWQGALAGATPIARESGLTFLRLASAELAATTPGFRPSYDEAACRRSGLPRLTATKKKK